MADYSATTRSNYFRVKDLATFTVWCRDLHLDVWHQEGDDKGPPFVAIASNDTFGAWPTHRWVSTQDAADVVEIDFAAELAAHLDPRDVAVLVEIGNEKLRYLCGLATAVYADGRTIHLSLDDIVGRARHTFGPHVTITEPRY